MPKRSFTNREINRKKIEHKYNKIRKYINRYIYHPMINNKLQILPLNSVYTRINKCCFLTGNPKSNLISFGLSRYLFREMAKKYLLPGITKLSW
uniref:ribosomal protein S14 n=1 Tax=Pogoniopsis schenckii TaxID=1582014 RepID=UPI002238988C|nr:ribosomal protein S14 [Pogoniopsis schenckii]YP_010555034.1 ribosomal protein S14 [Pogoniopsis schenckii]UYP51011.1 ribosomal protein S14 [Pogoniopsis schenckii]UYP51014.1 ribosomal protein S14 [Pogoniopsis schenckii]